jgi:hypothetical protein
MNNNGSGKGAMMQQKCVNAGIAATKCTAFGTCIQQQMQALFAGKTKPPPGSPTPSPAQRQANRQARMQQMQQIKTNCQQTAGFSTTDIANFPAKKSGQSNMG